MQMQMPENFNEVEYYGCGPDRKYVDRNHLPCWQYHRQLSNNSIHISDRRKPELRPIYVGGVLNVTSGNGLQSVGDTPFLFCPETTASTLMTEHRKTNVTLKCLKAPFHQSALDKADGLDVSTVGENTSA